MSNNTTAVTSWRHEAAQRLERGSTTLGRLLEIEAFTADHAGRARFAAGQLLGLGRALHSDAREPWPVVTTRDIEHRVRMALRELRIVARWHGTTSDQALAQVAELLDELEGLLREAKTEGRQRTSAAAESQPEGAR